MATTRPVGAYYSVKDQPLPPPSTYRGTKRRSSSSCCCCCLAWFCSFLITLIVIIGVGVLVFWLVVRPKTPKYSVEDVRITGLDTSSLTQSSLGTGTVTTNTTYSVEARNPNKKIGIYYDRISADLETSGVNIGSGTIPPFYQGNRNTTIITGDLQSQPLSIADVVKAGVLTNVQAGRVPLYLKVDVRARVKVGSWKSPRFTVKVRCNIDVNPGITTGTQVLSKSCSVKVRR